MSTNIHWQNLALNKRSRSAIKQHKPCILWFTGLSGSGKTTTANRVEKKLNQLGLHTYLLDGDNLRHGLNSDLGFSDQDRVENIRRIGEVARLFVDAGVIVLCSFISPFISDRRRVRELVEENEFIEIFVDAPLSWCEQRDCKGIYAKARQGLIRNFTGIDSAYEPPANPHIHLHTHLFPPDQCALQTIQYLDKHNFLKLKRNTAFMQGSQKESLCLPL